MRNYIGLDVSMKTTSVCFMDEKGKKLKFFTVMGSGRTFVMGSGRTFGHFQ